MELLLLVFFCLLTGSEVTFGAENEPKEIRVKEGSDVTLPCSLNTEDITNTKFVWKKDGRQVFLYDDGDHSNNVNTGQDQQFVRRVEYFRDKLKSGDASITISNTKVIDSGLYTCEFPDLQPSQIFHMRLIVVDGNILDRDILDTANDTAKEPKVIRVDEGRDATLPCSLNTKEDITNKKFVWKKDGRQVFLYDDGDHSNNAKTGQDQLFIGRVRHFPDKLKSGDASITISNMKVDDSGLYTCEFPDLQRSQIFYVKLIVYVKAPKPSLRILEQIGKSAELQCEVRGAFPKPELHWEDGARKKLPAEELQESERGGLFYIILKTTVYKTDNYRCVATQKEINHQTHDETYVFVPGLTAGETAAIVISVLVAAGLGLVVYRWRCRFMNCFRNVKASQLSVRILNQTQRAALLQCEVQGVFPKPELHWQDSDGNKLPGDIPQVTERGGLYDITLKTIVMKTDNYRCVVTQEEINHQTDAYIYVCFTEKKVIIVEEGSDAMLPCLFSTEDITLERLLWRKDTKKHVFLCDKGTVNSQTQDQLFSGRVEHFPDQLKSGIASIIINNTKATDSGLYTCEIRNLIFFMKLIVVGKTFITVDEGSDVMLPCSLHSRQDLTNKKFEWTKDDQKHVFLYDKGTVNNQTQDQQFSERVKYFPAKLKTGITSITIRDTTVADTGLYTCEFPKQIFRIQLIVAPTAPTAPGNGPAQDRNGGGKTFITVDEGSNAILPCSLNSKQSISSETFEWKKDGRQVFKYDKGQVKKSNGQVVHFPDELKSGNAFIIIRDTKVHDSGNYTCEFPDLQPRQIFHIQLVVAPNPRDDETAGLLTGKTDGGDVDEADSLV